MDDAQYAELLRRMNAMEQKLDLLVKRVPTATAERMRRYRQRNAEKSKRNDLPREKRNEKKHDSNEKANGAETWSAYAGAYFKRYGTEPIRNAKVNSLIAQFCHRVPQGEAPAIAAFYVRHNKQFYISSHHALGGLLKDAEGLRTEWATNRPLTETQARQTDKTAGIGNVFLDLMEDNRETKQ